MQRKERGLSGGNLITIQDPRLKQGDTWLMSHNSLGNLGRSYHSTSNTVLVGTEAALSDSEATVPVTSASGVSVRNINT